MPIGTAIAGGHELFGSYEDQHLDIAGPRTGKTSSRAIPLILAAPGAVLATSNKRDLLDATRDVRAATGPVWVFDPQQLALEKPTWWWNPLSYVTDEVRAEKLAEHFAAASTGERSNTKNWDLIPTTRRTSLAFRSRMRDRTANCLRSTGG